MTEHENGKTEEEKQNVADQVDQTESEAQASEPDAASSVGDETSPEPDSATDEQADDPYATHKIADDEAADSEADSASDSEPLREQVANLERITRQQAKVLGDTIKSLRAAESRIDEVGQSIKVEDPEGQVSPKEIEEIREEYGRMARQVHLIQRQMDLLKEHLDDHLSGRKPVDRWKHTVHQKNQKFGGAAGRVPGKSGRFRRFLIRLALFLALFAVVWYFLPDIRRKAAEIPFVQSIDNLFSQNESPDENASAKSIDVPEQTEPAFACPGGRDYAEQALYQTAPIHIDWLNHFQVVRTPQALLYMLDIEEVRFRQDLITLAKALAGEKAVLVENMSPQQWIRLDEPVNSYQSFTMDLRSTQRVRRNTRQRLVPWLEDYLDSSQDKPPADNMYYLWLQVVVDHDRKDGLWSASLERNLERYLDKRLPELDDTRQADQFLTALEQGVDNPMTPALQLPIKRLFNLASGDYTLQILALAEHLRRQRDTMEDNWLPINSNLKGHDFSIDAIFCASGRPTPLEQWIRAGKSTPDNSILMLWLASRLGLESSDGSPEPVINKLTFLKDHTFEDVARTCKL